MHHAEVLVLLAIMPFSCPIFISLTYPIKLDGYSPPRVPTPSLQK